MLEKISIKNFKSIKEVEMELGHVNVFVGANGSGKTNLLESFGGPRYFSSPSLHGIRPAVLRLSSFKNHDEDTGRLRFQFSDFSATAAYGNMGPVTRINASDKSGNDKFKDFDTIMAQYGVYSPNTPTLRGVTPDITQRKPVGLSGGRLAEAVEDLLDMENHLFGTMDVDDLLEALDWVDDIAIVPPSRELVADNVPTLRSIIRFTDRWMNDDRNQFSAYEASEGALYVLFVLTLAMHPDTPPLFAIDNFDQAMHPRLARATARLFCREILKQNTPPRQVLLTTHNPLVLDGLDLSDDRIRLFAVERDLEGATQVHRIQVADKILKSSAEGGEGLSLSRLWLMGRLGGVPDIF